MPISSKPQNIVTEITICYGIKLNIILKFTNHFFMNRNTHIHIPVLFLVFLIFSGCQKESDFSDPLSSMKTKKDNIPPKGFFVENRKVPGVVLNNTAANRKNSTLGNTSFQNSSPDPDNGDEPIILGQQLGNPYSVVHMQQAVNILYGGNYPISATHLYVRFKPNSVEQFIMLEEIEDLELQDFPMDYEVVQDGDYYQDPTQDPENFQWLYTVVQAGYNFPHGIQMEIIESLYLPEDNEILEDIAESMVAGAQYRSTRKSNTDTVMIQRIDVQVDAFNYLSEECPCEPDQQCPVWPDCGIVGGGGGGGNDPRIPRGGIEVQDIRTCNFTATPPTNIPVRQARIVCKRWFKIDRTYTNDLGQFVTSKKFKNKVKILLKTKNNHAKVSKIRGIRLWQILFPVKKRIGVFDHGAMANISYLFDRPASANAHDKDLPYWVAVTTHNSVLEYRQYAAEFGVGLPPSNLKILITNWEFMRAAGAAPLWNKCSTLSSDLSSLSAYAAFFIAGSPFIVATAGITALVNTLKNQTDVIIGYNALGGNYNCRLTSANLKSIAYHELGHTSHFAQAGCNYWQNYRAIITKELILGDFETRPYGDGTDNHAGLIAVGEMWGNHCEFIFSNRHYGNGGANGGFGVGFTARMQGADWPNVIGGLNAYLNAIENHNPNLTWDVHRWIPQGLPYDLSDTENDFITIGNTRPMDNVSGYSTQQCFNALLPNVRTIPSFKDRLLLQNGNNQQTQINQLFTDYGY